jgi:hypothetical protein
MTNTGIHISHCCALHGCKYAPDTFRHFDASCQVVSLELVQEGPCERCGYDDEEILELHIELNTASGWLVLDPVFSDVRSCVEMYRRIGTGADLRLRARTVSPWSEFGPQG